MNNRLIACWCIPVLLAVVTAEVDPTLLAQRQPDNDSEQEVVYTSCSLSKFTDLFSDPEGGSGYCCSIRSSSYLHNIE